jgi:hypothetical protein
MVIMTCFSELTIPDLLRCKVSTLTLLSALLTIGLDNGKSHANNASSFPFINITSRGYYVRKSTY